MKNENDIEDRLWILYNDRLKLRYKKFLSRYHRNCFFNEKIGLTDVYFCINVNLARNDSLHLCDERICAKCKLYRCKHTKDKVKDQFVLDISNPKICGQKEPKIAVLLWVLHGSNNVTGSFIVPDTKISFWRRLCRRISAGFVSI